ncbi:redoxin domain-containing protein [Candidatus Poribacteria bacterium]|nr:redoxin domain-containing protein [Candidatus Poribacteria bacterium]
MKELCSLQDAAKALEKLETVILAVSFRPVEFNKELCAKEGLNYYVLSDPDRAAIKKYFVWEEKDDCAQRVTFLIDQEGIIRRIERNVNPDTHGEDLIGLMKKWQKGRIIYDIHCARCHGDDGNATNYPNIKNLGGIGNRLTEKQILEATAAAGVVNLDLISKPDLDALAIYVGGL